ncbi:MAG: hypothetical protein M1834_005202 [Cirrosporium novae-zelandiae]|nr:MAG: hypothetical protein M1834_005202 [Cirrosporium novae-zelandiae]
MPILKKLTGLAGGAGTSLALGYGTFYMWSRDSQFVPVTNTEKILKSRVYRKYNPNGNPPLHDYCVKKVPLDKIKPELLEKKGKLVEAFCAGVWGGAGYSFQRAYFARKYRGPETAHQLWSTSSLQTSDYTVGTQITDHFEVLEHNPTSILVRCGGSPRIKDVRDSEGLFEMTAVVNKSEGVAEFGMRSIFYQGKGKTDKPNGPLFTWLHQQYTKLWMETAVSNVTK